MNVCVYIYVYENKIDSGRILVDLHNTFEILFPDKLQDINYREIICSQGCKGTFWANGDVPYSLSIEYWLHKCIYLPKFIQLYI